MRKTDVNVECAMGATHNVSASIVDWGSKIKIAVSSVRDRDPQSR